MRIDRELTELLRLPCQTASVAGADYELTSEPHHRLTLDTIDRLCNNRIRLRVVKSEERSLVSVHLSVITVHSRRLFCVYFYGCKLRRQSDRLVTDMSRNETLINTKKTENEIDLHKNRGKVSSDSLLSSVEIVVRRALLTNTIRLLETTE